MILSRIKHPQLFWSLIALSGVLFLASIYGTHQANQIARLIKAMEAKP
jgi:hypothetical protein